MALEQLRQTRRSRKTIGVGVTVEAGREFQTDN